MKTQLKLLFISLFSLICLKTYGGEDHSKSNKENQLNFIEYKSLEYFLNLESQPDPEVDFKQPVLNDYNHVQGFFCDFEDNISKNRKFKLDLGITGVQ